MLRAHLDRTMDLRMVSDVPVGIFLSGGVDSTGLASLMGTHTDRPIHSFSIGFADQPDHDEASVARATATRLGFVHHERVVAREDMVRMIDEVADVFDDPLADPTGIPIYFLAEMAREAGIKVVLTGDGPDELFLGYRNWQRYRHAYPLFRAWSAMPAPLRRIGFAAVRNLSRSERLVEMFHRAYHGQELFWGNAPSFRSSEKPVLLHPEFSMRARKWDSHEVIAAIRAEYDALFPPEEGARDHDVNWMSYVGLRFNIPNFYMLRADRLGMRHGVEVRAPYLDHDLCAFALSVPMRWKVKDGEPKYVFKRALEGCVPGEILSSPKKGFCIPLHSWGVEIMAESILDRMDMLCDDLRFMRRSALESRVRRFCEGDTSQVAEMWTLHVLASWVERWFKKGGSAGPFGLNASMAEKVVP